MSSSYRVEVEIEDILERMTDWEKTELVENLIDGGYATDRKLPMTPMSIEESLGADHANVLAAILWLRKHSYSVEPTGWDRG